MGELKRELAGGHGFFGSSGVGGQFWSLERNQIIFYL